MEEVFSTEVAKGKKSVALSGVVAGDTAICSVGRSGNDLHYRGYDVSALAEHATFEEVAYLLLYGRLPSLNQLNQYRKKLKTLRGLPVRLRPVLENLPASALRPTCCAAAARPWVPSCPRRRITIPAVRARLPTA